MNSEIASIALSAHSLRMPRLALVLIAAAVAALGFLYSFVTFLCAFALLLYASRIEIKLGELLTLTLPLCLALLYLVIAKNSADSIVSFRYYFGFWIGYLYFVVNRQQALSARHLLLAFLLLTLVEIFLLNQPWIHTSWRQDVLEGDNPRFATLYFGVYQRPFGVAFNPTMSSAFGVILVERCLAAAKTARWKTTFLILGLIIPILFFSATGLVVFFAMLALRQPRMFLIVVPLVAVPAFFTLQHFFADHYAKLTIDALEVLWEYKMDDLGRYLVFNSDCHRWFGNVACAGTYPLAYDDIGWLPFVFDMGIVGIALYFIIVLSHLTRQNAVPLFLVFLASWHYPVAFSAVGQFLVAGAMLNRIR